MSNVLDYPTLTPVGRHHEDGIEDVVYEAKDLLNFVGEVIVTQTTAGRSGDYGELLCDSFQDTVEDHFGLTVPDRSAAVIALKNWRLRHPDIDLQHVDVEGVKFDWLEYLHLTAKGDHISAQGVYFYDDPAQPYVPSDKFVLASCNGEPEVIARSTSDPALIQNFYDRLGEAYDDHRLANVIPFVMSASAGTGRAILQLIPSGPDVVDQ